MYVRKSSRRYKDRTYTNYLLVESVSTPKGPRQKVVCSLGDLRPRPREDWLLLARKVEAALAGTPELFEAGDAEVAQVVEKVRRREGKVSAVPGVVAVRAEDVAVERAREAGPVHVGVEFWKRLCLGKILRGEGLSPRAVKLVCAMALNRLIAPRSEHAMPAWMRRTAIGDLLGVPVERLSEDSLYRMLDVLHPRRVGIERALAAREGELFSLSGEILLYDLTSTYFEGKALRNPKARRGYSRDHRPDCLQVVVGLVMGREGFPLAHEVFEGNRQDRESLADMLDVLEARVGAMVGRTVVVDRGMAYADNLAEIRSRGMHYVVASRQEERGAWVADFEDDDAFVEMLRLNSPNNPAQSKPRVWIGRRERGEEVHILCRSEGRIAKDRAIREKQEERLRNDLEGLERRIEAGRLVRKLAIGEAIGRLKERYPRVARYWRIAYDEKTKRLAFAADEVKRAKAESLDGCYLLRTDRKDLSAEEVWRIYISLTRAEDAFRDMKSPLAERPIFHQLERRVETHIFLCLLAYHLLVAIETTLERRAVFTSWGTVRDALASHQVVTVVLPTDDGQTLRIRKATTPERFHCDLYGLLDVPTELMRPRYRWSSAHLNTNSDEN